MNNCSKKIQRVLSNSNNFGDYVIFSKLHINIFDKIVRDIPGGINNIINKIFFKNKFGK
jgi:hypothetical protein